MQVATPISKLLKNYKCIFIYNAKKKKKKDVGIRICWSGIDA